MRFRRQRRDAAPQGAVHDRLHPRGAGRSPVGRPLLHVRRAHDRRDPHRLFHPHVRGPPPPLSPAPLRALPVDPADAHLRAPLRAPARARGLRRVEPRDPLVVHRGPDGSPLRRNPGGALVARGVHRGRRRGRVAATGPLHRQPPSPSCRARLFRAQRGGRAVDRLRRALRLRDGPAQAAAARGGVFGPGDDAAPVGEAGHAGDACRRRGPRVEQPRGRGPPRRRAAPGVLRPSRGGGAAAERGRAAGGRKGAAGHARQGGTGARGPAERSGRARALGPRGRGRRVARRARRCSASASITARR